jgi:hypothetical protein
VLRWLLVLSFVLTPVSALAQEGGLGVTTADDDAGLGVATDEGEASDGDDDGLGVATDEGEASSDAEDAGLGVATDAGDEEGAGLGVATGEEDASLGVSSGGEEASGAETDDGGAQPETRPDGAAGDAAHEEAAEADAADGEPSDGDAEEEGAADGEADDAGADTRWTDELAIGWGVFGGSLAVGVLGAVLLAVGVDDLNTVENAPGGTDWDQVASAYDRAPALTATGAVVLGLGVAGTAVGAALLAVWGEEGTWLEVSALPGGVRVRGRF